MRWLALAALMVAILEWWQWPFLRWPMERLLAGVLGREVMIGDSFGIRLIGSLRVRTDRFMVGPPRPDAGFDDQREFLNLADLQLALPYATLLSLAGRGEGGEAGERGSRPTIDLLSASRLDLRLVRNAAGQANWRFGPERQENTRPLVLPQFGRLELGEGELRIDDVPAQLALRVAVHSVHEAASSPQTPARRGMQFEASGRYRDQPVSGQAYVGAGPLSEQRAEDATGVPIELQFGVGGRTKFAFAGRARLVPLLSAVHGNIELSGESLADFGGIFGLTLPHTPAFELSGQVSKSGTSWSATVAEMSVGRSRLNGDFSYEQGRAIPHLSGSLHGSMLALADLAPAIGAGGRKADGDRSRVLPRREFNTPALAAMSAEVDIALDEVDPGAEQLARIAPLRGRLVLADRRLSLLDLSAVTARGSLSGMLSFDARRQVPRWQLRLDFTDVRLDRFITARNPTDRQAAAAYVEGLLSGRVRLRGEGNSTARILGSLDGEMQAWIRRGSISHFLVEAIGLDVAQALGMALRGDKPLPMQCAVASIRVREGRAVPEVALIETSDSSLQATGTVSLADEQLDLIFKSAPKDVSPVSLRAPLHIEGSFARPELRIDREKLGLRVIGAAALAAITPLAGLLPLIDLGEEDKKACLEAAEKMRPRSAPQAARPERSPSTRE